MIFINKEQLFKSVEVKIIGIAAINVIIGIVLFAFQFSLLNNVHNPYSTLYLGPEHIGVTDILVPLIMSGLTYWFCHHFAAEALANQVPTAKLVSYAFLVLSFYCCFCFYAVVCSIGDPETRFSAQTCYIGLLLTSIFNALIPIGEILWILTLDKSNGQLRNIIAFGESERARLLFLMLPLFLFLFTIPWLTLPHLILLVVPSFIPI